MSDRSPNRERLDRFVQQAGHLYSLPRVAAEVLELTSDTKVDARKLKECIETDPALTAKLLRVVNSSLYGLSREVGDLHQALALLGVKPLKMLVLGFSLPETLFTGVEADLLSRYWQRTLVKAVAARELVRISWREDGDEAFIAGLLQEIGTLVLVQILGEPYVQFVGRMEAEEAQQRSMERQTLGFDRTELSARLLEHWHLPTSLVEAIPLPATPPQFDRSADGRPTLRLVLHLADLLAAVITTKQPAALAEALRIGRLHHGLTDEQLHDLITGLEDTVRQLAGVLSLSLPAGQTYAELLSEAHRRLAGVAEEVVEQMIRHRWSLMGERQSALLSLDESQQLIDAVNIWRPGAEPARRQETPGSDQGRSKRRARAATRWSAHAADSAAAGNEPSLLGLVQSAAAACRQQRRPLSLLLVQIDGFVDLVTSEGLERADQCSARLGNFCRRLSHDRVLCLALDRGQWAVVLPDCERQQAVRLGHELLSVATELVVGSAAPLLTAVQLSIGIAGIVVPPPNFSAEELITKADRCLYGASSAGGSSLKSIEL